MPLPPTLRPQLPSLARLQRSRSRSRSKKRGRGRGRERDENPNNPSYYRSAFPFVASKPPNRVPVKTAPTLNSDSLDSLLVCHLSLSASLFVCPSPRIPYFPRSRHHWDLPVPGSSGVLTEPTTSTLWCGSSIADCPVPILLLLLLLPLPLPHYRSSPTDHYRGYISIRSGSRPRFPTT